MDYHIYNPNRIKGASFLWAHSAIEYFLLKKFKGDWIIVSTLNEPYIYYAPAQNIISDEAKWLIANDTILQSLLKGQK